MSVILESEGPVRLVSIDRPDSRNAVDPETATALYDAMLAFDDDQDAAVAVLTGTGGVFSSGFDLKRAYGGLDEDWYTRHAVDDPESLGERRPGPMGPTRLQLSKPVIAAIEGPCVAGGMELALWCDLRVMADTSYMGVFCRRWGVPLIDGGAIRLPRIVGQGRALDLILTGRRVGAMECARIGLADRIAPTGGARAAAVALALEIARFPRMCMRADRAVALDQWSLPHADAFAREWRSAEAFRVEGVHGAALFAVGAGRSGDFSDV